LPAPGTPIMAGGEDVGELRSGADGLALAMLQLDALDAPLSAGGAKLTPQKPEWVKLY